MQRITKPTAILQGIGRKGKKSTIILLIYSSWHQFSNETQTSRTNILNF